MPEYLTLFTKELFGYIEDYGGAAASAGICFGGVFMAVSVLTGKKRTRQSWLAVCRRSLFAALFCSYVVMLLSITIFSRESGSITTVNLKPFDTFRYRRFSIENIMLFFPFGFFYGLAACSRKHWYARWYIAVLLGGLISVCIETVQFLTARGGAEIDDVITNTAGMICGYAAMALVRYAWREEDSL